MKRLPICPRRFQPEFFAVLFFCGFSTAGFCLETIFIQDPRTGEKVEVAADRITVKFRSGVGAALKSALSFSPESQTVRAISGMNADSIRVSSSTIQSALDYYRSLPDVEYAEPAYVVVAHATVTFNDPGIPLQYGHSITKIFDAWSITTGTGADTMTVGVIDSGVNYNHEDLGAGLGPNFTVIDAVDIIKKGVNPLDECGHGTLVSGVIAASINNGKGIAGVSANTKILSAKVFGSDCKGTTDDAAEAIIYATQRRVNILNLSFGTVGCVHSKVLQDSINLALAQRITVVASAGNDGNSKAVCFPAAYPGVIAVAASNSSDTVTSFSQSGPEITVAAPGQSILVLAQATASYTTASGTSFSAPYVSGIVALMLAAQPRLSPARVKHLLSITADDIETPGIDKLSGFGRVNAFRAVQAAKESPPGAFPPRDKTVPMPNPYIATGLSKVTFRIPEDLVPDNLSGTIETVRILDPFGREIRTLSGTNIWDGKNDDGNDVKSGIYYYEIKTAVGSSSSKVFLIR